MNYGLKLLVLQNTLARCYLLKAFWDPQNRSIKADLQHGYAVKQKSQISWDSCSPCKCSLPSSLLLLPPFSGSFPLLLGQTLIASGKLLSWVFSFSVAMTAAGDTELCPRLPFSVNSCSGLGQRFAFSYLFFFFFLFLQRKNKFNSTFWSFLKAHLPLACRGDVSFMLYQREFVCWRMKCPINLSSSTTWWGKSCIDRGHAFHFFRKPHLQQWLGNSPNPQTIFLFPDPRYAL